MIRLGASSGHPEHDTNNIRLYKSSLPRSYFPSAFSESHDLMGEEMSNGLPSNASSRGAFAIPNLSFPSALADVTITLRAVDFDGPPLPILLSGVSNVAHLPVPTGDSTSATSSDPRSS